MYFNFGSFNFPSRPTVISDVLFTQPKRKVSAQLGLKFNNTFSSAPHKHIMLMVCGRLRIYVCMKASMNLAAVSFISER
jgi:hypothetical protein